MIKVLLSLLAIILVAVLILYFVQKLKAKYKAILIGIVILLLAVPFMYFMVWVDPLGSSLSVETYFISVVAMIIGVTFFLNFGKGEGYDDHH